MKLIRTIFHQNIYYQLHHDKHSIYLSSSGNEHTNPKTNSIQYTVEEFNYTYFTKFKNLPDIIEQFVLLEEYYCRRLIKIIINNLPQQVHLYSITQTMFGSSISKELEPGMLTPTRTDFGTSLRVIYDQKIVIPILINSIHNRNEKTNVVAFHQSFLKILFGTKAEIKITDLEFLGSELTHKMAKYYLHHKDVSSPELKSKIKALERKYKISQI